MSQDEKEIRQLVADWADAAKKGDIPAILRLMTEDVIFLVPGQSPMIGRAAFEAAAKKKSMSMAPTTQFESTNEIQEIKVLGDWAFMWTKSKVTITPVNGAPLVTRTGPTLSILNKQHGRWVLARDANLLTTLQMDDERSNFD